MPGLTNNVLVPVVVETLASSSCFDFDLYLRPSPAEDPVLYRKHSYPLHRGDLESLRDKGIHTLYIPSAASDRYRDYLHNNVLADKSATPTARLCALKEVHRAMFLDALQSQQTNAVVEVADELGKDLAELVYSHEGVAQDLFGVLDHDYCTFTHVTNVCVYSVTLAKHLSISNIDELARIAAGALLHDVGKRHISPAILNKPNRLNEAETRLIRKHPQIGFDELSHRQDLSWSQLMMVYQHHERIDGRGYPVKLVGEEIDFWARICAIADVYEALTGTRAYHRGKSGAEASRYLTQYSAKAFDREMVACWTKSVKPIP